VLDPLNNLNTPCALALFLGSMDTTAKGLTRRLAAVERSFD
jgi:hypothetical protein